MENIDWAPHFRRSKSVDLESSAQRGCLRAKFLTQFRKARRAPNCSPTRFSPVAEKDHLAKIRPRRFVCLRGRRQNARNCLSRPILFVQNFASRSKPRRPCKASARHPSKNSLPRLIALALQRRGTSPAKLKFVSCPHAARLSAKVLPSLEWTWPRRAREASTRAIVGCAFAPWRKVLARVSASSGVSACMSAAKTAAVRSRSFVGNSGFRALGSMTSGAAICAPSSATAYASTTPARGR